MSLRKVYGGTPLEGGSRCDTCANARIIQGYAESERLVFCHATYPVTRVPFKVSECTMYDDKRLPDLDDLKEIAWQLRTKSAGSRAGFVVFSPPAKSQDDGDEDID